MVFIDRVIVFIDGSNLYHGLKRNVKRTDIDFYKFPLKLCGDQKLIRTYYYTAPLKESFNPQQYKDQQKFFSTLYQTKFLELKLGKLVPRGNTHVEKGVDIKIAVDMMKYAYLNNYDTAILVTGDGDFAPVIKAVKDMGKHVVHTYFTGASNALKTEADDHIPLSANYFNNCFKK